MKVLTHDEIERYSRVMELPEEILRSLERGEFYLDRIADAAKKDPLKTGSRVKALNFWGDDPLSASDVLNDVVAPDRLGGDGYFLVKGGVDSAMTVHYPVKNEKRRGINPILTVMGKISGWGDTSRYLNSATGRSDISPDNIWHLYDYSVAEGTRERGIGRFMLRYSVENTIGEGDVSVGFIEIDEEPDENHVYTMKASPKSGRFFSREAKSPYCNLPAIQTLFYKGMEPKFTGNALTYPTNAGEMPRFIEEIKSATAAGNFVGYNMRTRQFETASLRQP